MINPRIELLIQNMMIHLLGPRNPLFLIFRQNYNDLVFTIRTKDQSEIRYTLGCAIDVVISVVTGQGVEINPRGYMTAHDWNPQDIRLQIFREWEEIMKPEDKHE